MSQCIQPRLFILSRDMFHRFHEALETGRLETAISTTQWLNTQAVDWGDTLLYEQRGFDLARERLLREDWELRGHAMHMYETDGKTYVVGQWSADHAKAGQQVIKDALAYDATCASPISIDQSARNTFNNVLQNETAEQMSMSEPEKLKRTLRSIKQWCVDVELSGSGMGVVIAQV